MYSDPISDMLTRIRNGIQVNKHSVDVPASRFKEQIAKLLVREGFLLGLEKVDLEGKPFIRVALRYGPNL
ncbi:MAG: 30S ribosomal protein S8, partial [Deinococcus sp.]|nr:30S ribosomal protein S8 [Deinococcus sp.]